MWRVGRTMYGLQEAGGRRGPFLGVPPNIVRPLEDCLDTT